VARRSHRRHRFEVLLADAGYDGEHHHRFLSVELGVRGIIPPTRGRPAKDPSHIPSGFYRGALATHWPKEQYGQRWQVETSFSMLKRLLNSSLRSRRRYAIDREILLRVLTLNLMIIWRLVLCFQQSRTGSFLDERAEQ
jgi:transposase